MGKSSLVHRFVKGYFKEFYEATIGGSLISMRDFIVVASDVVLLLIAHWVPYVAHEPSYVLVRHSSPDFHVITLK